VTKPHLFLGRRRAGQAHDLECDRQVGLADLVQLLANYATTRGATYADGDLDLDDDLDLSDLAALLSVYSTACS
jgi:hypothetical protein